MILRTNVKLNLGLRVLGRRADGYHDLETLFVPCDAFGDVLEVEPSDEFRLELCGPEYCGWAPEDDLVAKAWRLLREETLRDSALAAICPWGLPAVHVRLEKHSPVGAGLGGGSADGAFMLKALNDLFSLGLSEDALAARAALLGSDCAFFIYNRPMFATGRGEVLEPFDIDLSGYRFEVVVPDGVAVSTREAYAGLDEAAGEQEGLDRLAPLDPTSPQAARSPLLRCRGWHVSQPSSSLPLREALRQPISEWKDTIVNDFERSVFPLYPSIAALKQQMYAKGAVYASMTGSGSAVFGIFPQ